jgi:hypothetical protein
MTSPTSNPSTTPTTKIPHHLHGPWAVTDYFGPSDEEHSDEIAIQPTGHGTDGPVIAAVWPLGDDVVTQVANARLIAAAPDLLYVAGGFVATLATMDRTYKPEDIYALLDKWADVARAAIAKAEGGAR